MSDSTENSDGPSRRKWPLTGGGDRLIGGTLLNLGGFADRRDRWHAMFLAFGSLLAGVLEAAVLVLVVSAAVGIADGDPLKMTLPLLGQVVLSPRSAAIAAGFAGLALTVTHLVVAYLAARLLSRVLGAMRRRVIAAFANASTERQSIERSGALHETAGTLSVQSAELVGTFATGATGGMGLFAYLLTSMLISPVATVVVVAFGGTLFLALKPLGTATQNRSLRYVGWNSEYGEQVADFSTLATELRVFGVTGVESDRLERSSHDTAEALRKSRFASLVGSSAYRDVAVLSLVAATVAMTTMGSLELAAIGAVVVLIVRALSYAQVLNSALQSLRETGANLILLVDRVESLERNRRSFGTATLESVGAIELDEVSYSYDDARPAVQQLTLRIDHGTTIGVLGPSGGGKSTLAQILLRLRTPTSGHVKAAGRPYDTISESSWRRLTALVAQEPSLFEGTVAENIRFMREDISMDEIRDAAAAAHVIDDILALPEGFETRLGPRGSGLSGGQRQRVAIARALVGGPDLLVLDEPTSSLDVRSEHLLQRTIDELRGRITVVIVAHRLTTLSGCDRVIAIEDGQIRAIGTLDEAMAAVSLNQSDLLTNGEAAVPASEHTTEQRDAP